MAGRPLVLFYGVSSEVFLSTPFPSSMRSLAADSFRGPALILLLAAALLAAWAAWLGFGQITLYEVSTNARLISISEAQIVAEFPPAALMRIRTGQRAQLWLDGFPNSQYGAVAATVVSVLPDTRSGQIEVRLVANPDPASPIPIRRGFAGVVEVEVEQVAPAILALRAAGLRVHQPASSVNLFSDEVRR
jgi:hypothetical protein